MIFQTLLIVFWVLFVGIVTTVTGKLLYDYWLQLVPIPTSLPTSMPTAPTYTPTLAPTAMPTTAKPTLAPTTAIPSAIPTPMPTTRAPTIQPTLMPTPYDNCFELAYYYCLTCVPEEMKPTLPCGRNYYAPAKCPDNAHCSRGYYTCDPGYKATYINPYSWGDRCQYCSLSHTCVPETEGSSAETTYLRH